MNKKTFLILIIISLVLIAFYFFKKDSTPEGENILSEEREQAVEIVKYSRINFFLSSPHKASLAIPDYWEGNYRVKENGNKVAFYYFEGVLNESELFSISFYPEKEYQENTEDIIIGESDGIIFVFRNGENDSFDNDMYFKMLDSVTELIKSFKISK
ncbi:hypothetical protein C0584_03250 [Candidatus Parcubacteria bacterium]|nr:MAG: hypothetical protein C0584_03250 [Candidatus Parcubacteria bacterium]